MLRGVRLSSFSHTIGFKLLLKPATSCPLRFLIQLRSVAKERNAVTCFEVSYFQAGKGGLKRGSQYKCAYFLTVKNDCPKFSFSCACCSIGKLLSIIFFIPFKSQFRIRQMKANCCKSFKRLDCVLGTLPKSFLSYLNTAEWSTCHWRRVLWNNSDARSPWCVSCLSDIVLIEG